MQKLISLLSGSLLFSFIAFSQTAPSPETFLGYRLGDHYTPHYKIVNYFREVARSLPAQVKLEEYGKTYEGRPLLLAFIASPENLQRLEDIRKNNLRLAGVLKDGTTPDESYPAIVWLSYNVHGNEPSSSEAAMKTLYTLVDPASTRSKEWLQHTVVVIDPCINPDGRDRYVNWFTMAVGKNANPDPQSREHREPWPGGRTNHYNFDLNRDWAWQTQIETQQRMKKYNVWLPQVHVDFHEQSYNNPYYFAPAAEPYHDVITPWQRDFQVQIGKNNARYFDRNGWLYFTKEEFDLFYPSYGDTYPTYNGAIGMTFEQGGSPRGGLAVIKNDDDTLTLADRLEHHYTTGISTIEVAAQNASRLIKEFHKYFTEARERPAGEFKAWLIRNDPYGDRLERLKVLLEKNNIEWSPAPAASFTGIDYETGKMAAVKASAGDIVINANQPRSNLLRVLFERTSRISDSVTYDITAWSIPYVYGLQTYGLNAFAQAGARPAVSAPTSSGGAAAGYAYAVRWTGLNNVRFLSRLLEKGIKVRFTEQAFQSGGQEFEKGTLLILATGNGSLGANLWTFVTSAAESTGVTLYPILSGFVDKGADFGSDKVHFIHAPKVGLLTGEQVSSLNAGEVWHLFERELDYPISQLDAEDIGRLDLKKYDVLILPNGNYRSLADKTVAEPLRSWVREGGKLIAMENAAEQLSKLEWGFSGKDQGDKKEDDKGKKEGDYSSLHRYGNRQRDEVVKSVPGSIYRVELDNSHPLAFGYPDHYYTLKQDDNVYEFMKEGGWNVGVIKKDNYVSGFTGNKAKEKLKDGVIFGVQEMGRGEIVYMADDPLFRSFWENGKLLFCNAVFLVGE
ncbi:M14 family metallopeptidase [Flavitalea sp. BT771]|uniref:M14 family metallopeptidase n=1 Tax=Flavitalea sp. BT771 TaxID=3063329 RepID=UPI0026E4171B|nr:M14 family metallopeptidase [Flavitalea sp. BT771]MDO6430985.1 M14 family metallopeptidase [Flavitalea sp. BT771]MDV6219892.1 M14 family metallopeptidase [Flavitalea sp. BT771]